MEMSNTLKRCKNCIVSTHVTTTQIYNHLCVHKSVYYKHSFHMVTYLNSTRRRLEGMDQSELGQGKSITWGPDRPWCIDNLTI